MRGCHRNTYIYSGSVCRLKKKMGLSQCAFCRSSRPLLYKFFFFGCFVKYAERKGSDIFTVFRWKFQSGKRIVWDWELLWRAVAVAMKLVIICNPWNMARCGRSQILTQPRLLIHLCPPPTTTTTPYGRLGKRN